MYDCNLKSYIYIHTRKETGERKEKRGKKKINRNRFYKIIWTEFIDHVTRVFLAYKKKIDVRLISLLAGLQRHAYRWIDVSPANKRGQFRIHQYPCELKRFERWKGYHRAGKIMNVFTAAFASDLLDRRDLGMERLKTKMFFNTIIDKFLRIVREK